MTLASLWPMQWASKAACPAFTARPWVASAISLRGAPVAQPTCRSAVTLAGAPHEPENNHMSPAISRNLPVIEVVAPRWQVLTKITCNSNRSSVAI
jgi:hypothetical protein